MGLQGALGSHAALRRKRAPQGFDDRRLASHLRRSGTLLRQGRVRDRRRRQGRQHSGQDRSAREHFRRTAAARVSDAAASRHWIHRPDADGRSAGAYHGYCDSCGCHVDAKNSTSVTTIPAAQKTKNLTIVERAHVTRILTDNNGKVTGVQYLREGQEYFQPAKAVVLSAQTYEN